MSSEVPEIVERAWALVARVGTVPQRLLSRPDAPLAAGVLLALLAIIEVSLRAEDVGTAMLANLLATLPIVQVRQRLPWAAATIVLGVVIALSGDTALLTLAAAVALVSVAYLLAGRYGRSWSAVFALPFLVNVVAPFSEIFSRATSVLLFVVVVGALALGDARRERGEAVAERDEAQRDQALLEERARIARELHDVVAHHVSMIAVQAETARLTTPDLTEEGKERFKAIGDTARDSLVELRRLLGMLREDSPGGSGAGAAAGARRSRSAR